MNNRRFPRYKADKFTFTSSSEARSSVYNLLESMKRYQNIHSISHRIVLEPGSLHRLRADGEWKYFIWERGYPWYGRIAYA